VEDYITLGPLGTAIASTDRPRAVLIDEIDKSDLDLPSDLLNVLEEGYFDIPQLVREPGEGEIDVRGADRGDYRIAAGRVAATHFPVIVFASNGERSFPPPFLRRCVRYTIPVPDAALLGRIVGRHLGALAADGELATIQAFADRLKAGDTLAVDQLLNVVHLMAGNAVPDTGTRKVLHDMLLQSLGR
jgi:MoxR-like ATPase